MDEPEWHMIIGGKNVEDLSSVELFNWKTGEQCPMEDLPYGIRIHAANVFDGVPLICGGFSAEKLIESCFKYSNVQQEWTQVRFSAAQTMFFLHLYAKSVFSFLII